MDGCADLFSIGRRCDAYLVWRRHNVYDATGNFSAYSHNHRQSKFRDDRDCRYADGYCE
jgi:hypothetical protein